MPLNLLMIMLIRLEAIDVGKANDSYFFSIAVSATMREVAYDFNSELKEIS